MDADLFMECEEEELEPWQQQLSVEDPVANAENNTSTSGTSTVSSTPATVHIPAEPKTVIIPNLPSVMNAVSTVPLLTNTLAPQVVSAAVPADIPKPVQGQQVILTPSAGGLSTVALSQVLLPGTSQITNAANGQPIYFTTQGLPVQNIHPGQSPMGLVLNVQQGQTVRPFTLVQAPGTQIFKPAVGSTQIITQPAQIRSAAPVANMTQTPGSFSTMQIPATLTIRTTTAVTLPAATSLTTMSSTTAQTSTPRTTTKIVTIKSGSSPLELQNLMSLVKSVNLPGGAQAQTFVVMSNQKTNGPTVVSSAVPPTPQTVVQTTPVINTSQCSASLLCPRCGAQFKMIEALRSHMCFCCPDAKMTGTAGETSAVAKTSDTQTTPKTLSVVPKPKTEGPPSKGGEAQSKLVMLVDDFYYGTFEGNRVYVPMDNLKEPLSFRCLTCHKRLKNNIRLMTHMKQHVELEQQNGEMDTHTSCQHCFRHFPTPFRLQCHLESVHTAVESSTKCKICEWSFENEPVFLQHMKNTHKPGEMPYVCQVCEYRSSFYSDVFSHFCTWHEDTRHLLCKYCLKVFKNSTSYQQHFVRHQKLTVYHCNKCRLQFLFTKDKVEHKINHHKTFRKPRELEGLQPGTKVTIRAYVGQKKIAGQMSSKRAVNSKNSVTSSQTANSSDQHSQKHGPGRKQVSKMFGFLVKFQEQRALLGKHKCVECAFEIPDFANHYPTYVHCSLCFYSTCCSRAYANHMINSHVPGRMAKAAKKGPPSGLRLSCTDCAYATTQGNLMAKHLVKFPAHSSCIFILRECLETDIEFCQVEEEEVEGPQASDVGTQPDWLSMEYWSVPRDEETVPEFTDSCGPQRLMTRTNDAFDYFQLLFPDVLFDQIVYETNAYASFCCSLGRGDPSWYPVAAAEIKGFFGLCILMGLDSRPDPEMYWSSDFHRHGSSISKTSEVFYWAMSVARFKQIRAHIRMSSMIVENDNQSADKLLFFQHMLSVLQTCMEKAYSPNKCLTIDQAFLPSYEKGIAREKSTNSQPKIWLLCDSKSGYCHKLLVLTQQEKHRDLGKCVVPHLIEGLQGKHHHIFLSSSLASVPLMQELYEHGIYTSTSIQPNSPILPNKFWDLPLLENPGYFQQYEYPPLLITRWKDSKQLVCLSTNAEAGHPDTVWRRSAAKIGDLASIERPLAFKLLQDNMRGVDICNQLLTCNQLGGLILDTNWRRLFWFLVNLSVINSFIILRETRKDNPPAWFPGGHFSQALYRKRLGYQLASFAATYARQNQTFNSTLQQRTQSPIKKESLETQEGIRHHLAKISRRTKRCKVCNMRNWRHESVYGCTVCLVNLCKRSCCFWDYHGFPPNFQGNPRVGFVAPKREGRSSALDYNTERFKSRRRLRTSLADVQKSSRGADAARDEGVDQEMAPLEDTDLETDTTESDMEQHQTLNKEKKAAEVANATFSQPIKDREEPLSIHQRRILLLALCSGIQKASKEMSTKPQLIQMWLRNREKNLDEVSSSRCGEAGDRLVEWVLAQREQQRPISESKLFEKASEMQSQTNESGAFRISYEWAVSFMLQHKLGLDVFLAQHRELPNTMEENCQRFTESVHSQIKTNNVQQCVIGAMDQLSVFVDFKLLRENTRISKETALQLTGSGKPFVKIYLSVLADGTVLPAMLFTNHGGSKLHRSTPDSVIIMSKGEGFSGKEEMEVWATQVWKRHLDSKGEKESLLVMDSHHSHMSEDFMCAVSSTKTLPAIVPVGCTGRHQPLEMCVRPVLQKLFLARWAQQSASDVQPEDLLQLLVSWLGEAMSCFSCKPEIIQHSFCLARLIPDHSREEHTNLPGTPLELFNLLSDATLGPEVVEIESAEEDEPMDTCTVNEKIDLTQEPETVEDEIDQTDDKDRTPTERNEIEHQTHERPENCSEITSESTDISHLSPKSDAASHNSEQDNFSESCQDHNADQTYSASNR